MRINIQVCRLCRSASCEGKIYKTGDMWGSYDFRIGEKFVCSSDENLVLVEKCKSHDCYETVRPENKNINPCLKCNKLEGGLYYRVVSGYGDSSLYKVTEIKEGEYTESEILAWKNHKEGYIIPPHKEENEVIDITTNKCPKCDADIYKDIGNHLRDIPLGAKIEFTCPKCGARMDISKLFFEMIQKIRVYEDAFENLELIKKGTNS